MKDWQIFSTVTFRVPVQNTTAFCDTDNVKYRYHILYLDSWVELYRNQDKRLKDWKLHSKISYFHHLRPVPFSKAYTKDSLAIFVPQVPIVHGWIDYMEWQVCPTLLHMIGNGNRTSDHLILSPKPVPLGQMLLM